MPVPPLCNLRASCPPYGVQCMVKVAWLDCSGPGVRISMACHPVRLVRPAPPTSHVVETGVVPPGPKVRGGWVVSIPPSLRKNLYVPLTPGGAVMVPVKTMCTGQCPVGDGLTVKTAVIGLLGLTGCRCEGLLGSVSGTGPPGKKPLPGKKHSG
jgi:hypothetical protein